MLDSQAPVMRRLRELDALHVGDIYREIGRIVARLWIRKGNAIQENRNLVVRSAHYIDVRLNTKPSTLSDISSRREFEHVV